MGKKKTQGFATTYSAGVHFVLCQAPIDALLKIFVDKKIIWEASVTSNTSIYIDKPELFGGLTREGGIYGFVDILFGRASQARDDYLMQFLGSNIPAYRQVVSAVLRQVWFGTNYYLKSWSFLVTRTQTLTSEAPQWLSAYANPSQSLASEFEYIYTGAETLPENFGLTTTQVHKGYFVRVSNGSNPANGTSWVVLNEETLDNADSFLKLSTYPLINAVHVIRECLTDTQWGMGIAEVKIDSASFESAAITCFNEKLGFSWLYTKDTPLTDFIDSICSHINAILYKDRFTELWKLKLIRQVTPEELATAFVLSAKNTKAPASLQRTNLASLTNQVQIKYPSLRTFEDAIYRTSNAALVARQGNVNLKSLTFEGIKTPEVAKIIGDRELKTLSTPLYTCSIEGDRSLEVLNPGDVVILKASTELQRDIIFRVETVNLGTAKNEAVSLELLEDVFYSTEDLTASEPGSIWIPPSMTPRKILNSLIGEIPYYYLAKKLGDAEAQVEPIGNTGMFIAVKKAQSTSPEVKLYTTTSTNYKNVEIFIYSFYAKLAVALSRTETLLQFKEASNLYLIEEDAILQLGEELISIVSIDLLTDSFTVLRGVLDTIPKEHAIDTELFCTDFTGVDQTPYLEGETVYAKVTSITSQGESSLSEADQKQITFIGRKDLPYPPGNFTINGTVFNTSTLSAGTAFTISWSSRNRFLQTAKPVDYFSGNIASESDVTYTLNFYNNATNDLLHSWTGTALTYTVEPTDLWVLNLSSTIVLRVELFSTNLNGDSFQKPTTTFSYTVSVTGTYIIDDTGAIWVDNSGNLQIEV